MRTFGFPRKDFSEVDDDPDPVDGDVDHRVGQAADVGRLERRADRQREHDRALGGKAKIGMADVGIPMFYYWSCGANLS